MGRTSGGAGGGTGGSTGSTDNAVLRADGTGGATLQGSDVTIGDVSGSNVSVSASAGNAITLVGTEVRLSPSTTGDVILGNLTLDTGANPNILSYTGQAANGALIFASDGTITKRGSTAMGFTTAGNARRFLIDADNGLLQIGLSSAVAWYSHADPQQGSADCGLARNAAGVVRVTDGSTGNGRVLADAIQLGGVAAQPAAAAGVRGMIWYTPGGAGVADKLEVCAKSAGDTYSWVPVATPIT